MGPGLRRLNSDFATKFISEKGTMPKNRDYFGFVELDGFACWVIAEAYDNEIEISSAKLAVDTVLAEFTRKPSLSKKKLKSYVKEAHRQLKRQSNKFILKSSIMIVATNYKRMRYAHCGNCRLHIFRGDAIAHKSLDQSLYQEMVKQGRIPDDEQYTEESRNLFNYLGKRGLLKVSVSKKMILYDEDILLLSTWGFWEKVATIEMLDALEDSLEPEDYLDQLQDLFLSKQDGHVNNFTLATVFVKKTFQEKNNRKKIILIIVIVSAIIIIAAIIIGIILWRSAVNRANLIESIAEQEHRGNIHLQDRNFDRALTEFDNAIISSEDLGGIRRRLVTENQEIRDNLAARQRITQLMSDGEALFRNSSYQEARFAFERARDEAGSSLVLFDTDILDFLDIVHLESRIALTHDHEFIQSLVLTADAQAALLQFDLALASYHQAMRVAENIGNISLQRDIALMIERTRSQALTEENARLSIERERTEQERADRLLANEIAELEASRLLREGHFERAVEMLASIQDVFIELGEVSRAAAIEQRIADARDGARLQADDEQAAIALGYLQLGDNYMLVNNFNRALDNFRLARDIFTLIRRPEDVTMVNERISLAITRQTETDMANSILNITQIENEGDELLLLGDYDRAIQRYRQAQILFRGINQMDRVLLLEEKIGMVNERIGLAAERQAEIELANTIFNIMQIVAEGDELLLLGYYAYAIERYTQAQILFRGIGEMDRVLLLEEKIRGVRDLGGISLLIEKEARAGANPSTAPLEVAAAGNTTEETAPEEDVQTLYGYVAVTESELPERWHWRGVPVYVRDNIRMQSGQVNR